MTLISIDSQDTDLSRESSHTLVGQVLADTYLLERVIAIGGMSTVYAAQNRRTQGLVAIKFLRKMHSQNPRIYARFRDEAMLIAALRHPNIVQAIDLGELPDGRPYIVMEYLEGVSLQRRLRGEGRMSLATALPIISRVAYALHAAHQIGVVHRDITPNNILMIPVPFEDREGVKVIDFGVSRVQGSLKLSHTTYEYELIGTPTYMSPEATLGLHSQIDGRSDQFSLAVILYQMLAGSLPFQDLDEEAMLYKIAYEPAPPLEDLAPGLPDNLYQGMRRALSKRKEARFDTVLDFISAISPSEQHKVHPSQSTFPPKGTVPAKGEDQQKAVDLRPPPRVLVVDDDVEVRTLLAELFQFYGYTCRMLASEDGMMPVAAELAPDLVVLDVVLPGRSGYKLCWDLRRDPAFQRTRIIILSGKAQETDRKMGLAMGADAYVEKPFNPEELMTLIESLLQNDH